MKRNKILVVDDVKMNRTVLIDMMKEAFGEGYEYLEAHNGKEALVMWMDNVQEICLMVIDMVMPVMDGYQVLEELHEKKMTNGIPIVVVTAMDSVEAERRVYECGAVDYIRRPFDRYVAQVKLKNTLDLYQHKNELEHLVQTQMKKLDKANELLLDTMSNIVEFRNLESGMHVKRIKKFTDRLLRDIMVHYPEYGLDDKSADLIVQASSMHDIGKITVPDAILLKPGKLTEDEFEVMKQHTTQGAEMIINSLNIIDERQYRYCYEICKYHHERFDGKGYPEGLVGDDIPISAQIVALADVYDALVSKRIYKDSVSKEKAFFMIHNGECGAFSDKIMSSFKRVRHEFEELAENLQ